MIVSLTALVTAIGVALGAWYKIKSLKQQVNTNTQNTQALAGSVMASGKAINADPGSPNVPQEVIEVARRIRNDPAVPTSAPHSTDPV